MAVSQVAQSFQNDGNFSQLDLRDIAFGGPIVRIETFRCSQPDGDYGKTAAGTSVTAIAGLDHLTPTSNRVFRHIFSVGSPDQLVATLEIREEFNEDGSMDVRMRDIDANSSSFGTVVICSVTPYHNEIRVRYEIRSPSVKPVLITSPLYSGITQTVSGLSDLSVDPSMLGSIIDGGELEESFSLTANNQLEITQLDKFSNTTRTKLPDFSQNVKVYERMGDFRDKCIHTGTNLTGSNPALASEFILIRAYRISLITMGRIFDDEMSAGAHAIDTSDALMLDTKPGVYSAFLSAYGLNIGLYQLGLDKVHSDYGGIPMKLSPGSRLENGAEPIVDATQLNQALAMLASIYYLPSVLPQIASVVPSIKSLYAKT